MKTLCFYLILFVIVMSGTGAGRILLEIVVLLAGTAAVVYSGVQIFSRVRFLGGLRGRLHRIFIRLPVMVGFPLFTILFAALVSIEVWLLRDIVMPRDSWLIITLGFLAGTMDALCQGSRRGSKLSEWDADDQAAAAVEQKF